MVGYEDLCDGVVKLVPLGLADVAEHLAGEDAELAHWLNGGPGTRATVEAHIRRCMSQWSSGGPIHAFGIRTVGISAVGISAGERQVLVGTLEVQFDRAYLAPDEVNISYGIYPAWRRRGLATRAVELGCRHAAASSAARAVIRTDVANVASAAVARRAGFTHLRRRLDSDGAVLDWFVRDLHVTAPPLPPGAPT